MSRVGAVVDIAWAPAEAYWLDYTGDGGADNGWGNVLAIMYALHDIGPPDGIALSGVATLVLAQNPERLALFTATNDLDADGDGDASREALVTGRAVFRLTGPGRTGPYRRSDRGVALEVQTLPIVLPILETPIPVTLRDARLEGELREDERGLWTEDHEVEFDSVPTLIGSVTLGGIVSLPELYESLEHEVGGRCGDCAHLGASPFLTHGEDPARGLYEVACSDYDAEGCAGIPFCDSLQSLCAIADIASAFADVDTTGDGIEDALSFGAVLRVAPATLIE